MKLAKTIGQWVGVWGGAGDRVRLRCEIMPDLDGAAWRLALELTSADLRRLRQGIVLCIADGPDGAHGCGISTHTGTLLFRQTPDDPGVLALIGEGAGGKSLSLTLVEDGRDRLLFTGLSGPPGEAPRISVHLQRQTS